MRRLLLLLAIGAVGCRDERLRETLPPDVRVDTYQQQASSRVDVLWVVDNSGSMAPMQENLASNFQSFIQLFSQHAVDFRIAVTTTHVFGSRGAFFGAPAILEPRTPGLTEAFARNIRVGTAGSPFEAGMEAALAALERQRNENAPILRSIQGCQSGCQKGSDPLACSQQCVSRHPVPFLRPDAHLYVIFVSDEEDKSQGEVGYYWRALKQIQGIGNDATVSLAAIVGTQPNTPCGARHGTRYLALTEMSGGERGDICDPSFALTLRNLATSAVGLKRKFALSTPPNPDTIEVRVRYPCNTAAEALTSCVHVDRSRCDGAPADAVAQICHPKQGLENGWSYEPANRAIYFAGDSVPGLNAQIELQYYDEGTQP